MAISPLFGQNDPFFSDYEPKNATIPLSHDTTKISDPATITVTMNAGDTLRKVSKYLYGNNANVWMGQMVSDLTLINYLQMLSPRILRFPGGNLSNAYYWNAPKNQPPNDVPDTLYDSNGLKTPAGYWFGKNTESWTLSLDNYYAMLAATGNTGIITTNYGYARYGNGSSPVTTAAHLAADWVRYDGGRTKFWEIGNENFGSWEAGYQIDTMSNHDGQPRIITGEVYGKHFLVFADSMRKAASEIGSTISIGAQLIEYDASAAAEPIRSWNSGFFRQAANAADFFIVHSYYTPYNQNSTADIILNYASSTTAAIMSSVNQTTSQNGVLMKPIALTEWNIFAVGSKQMCSFINGIHAAIVLGELAHAGFSMASRWDLANGYDNGNDHGIFNIGDEPNVPKWNPRPPFFFMYYFQQFFGDHIINTSVAGESRFPSVLSYASTFHSGHAGIVFINMGTTDQVVKVDPLNYVVGDQYYVYSLTGGSENGEFSQKVFVNGHGPTHATGGPIDGLSTIEAWSYPTQGDIKFFSPARSVQYVLLTPGGPVGVNTDNSLRAIHEFTLDQNYPNPFNPSTTIRFSIPERSRVRVTIFNLLGQQVAELANEEMSAGNFARTWSANVASGLYLYKIEAVSVGDPGKRFVEMKKMILLK